MTIDTRQVERIAGLARLHLTEPEKEMFLSQLQGILDYVEKLRELDTSGVEPTSHVLALHNVFRVDERRESLPLDAALQNAPDRAGNFYRVPRIIE